MKIRVGFVSNSSSSSFCAWGVSIDEISEEKWHEIESEIDNLSSGLAVLYSWESEMLYIGRPYKNIGDDETGRAFKKNAEEKIKKITDKFFDGRFIHFEHFEGDINT